MTNLKKISIDGIEVEVDGAMTIIQAAEVAGVEIPRFCYHERLTIAGNCRMCLVEVVGGPPKPAASCAMQVRDLRPSVVLRLEDGDSVLTIGVDVDLDVELVEQGVLLGCG